MKRHMVVLALLVVGAITACAPKTNTAGASMETTGGAASPVPAATTAGTGLTPINTDMDSLTATRFIPDSKVIPAPEPTFGGAIQNNVSQSRAWWPPAIVPKKGSPNILLILIDDEGFGAPSTFGGMIPTPVLDQLAKEGLRYNNFHTTSLCSPTRAALITGRNHHNVGFGMVADFATGFPGYNSIIPRSKMPVARILQANGYATAWFGKDHNVPGYQVSMAGPKDQWPTGQGFDYFYGFLGGDMDQWNPTLFENTNQILPSIGHPGYNLNVDLADKAIAWLTQINELRPTQPVFMYYCPGAVHAPHQPTPDWIAKFKGKFDYGWNAYRDYVFKRQQAMGIIPKTAKLTPWPDNTTQDYNGVTLPTWDSLTPFEKRAYAHEMEVFAAYLAQTDYEVGRVIQTFKNTGRYNNTLIIYISGDNGSSGEGTLYGTPSEALPFNAIVNIKPYEYAPLLPLWGSEYTEPHFPVSWAWATDTPFKYTKAIASFFGGTKNGMTVVWPGHITDPGAIRTQFAHVIDVVPTILEAAGITPPDEIDGVKQDPIDGTSFLYTFDKANATLPSRHHAQYFEMFGARAEYEDGWIAATDPLMLPWLVFANRRLADPWGEAKWHLYHVTPDDDWTEYTDVKSQYPDKLKELQDLFVSDAQKYHVLPLNNLPTFLDPRPSLLAGRSQVVYYPGLVNLDQSDAPNILNRDYSIEGDVTIGSFANGVIVSDGGRFGGYSLWMRDGTPRFSYNFVGIRTTRWFSLTPIRAGHHIIKFNFVYDGPGLAKGGVGTLSVDGKVVDSRRIEHTTPLIFQWTQGLSIGTNILSEVDKLYRTPNSFSGTINKVTYHTGPMQLSAAQRREYYAELFGGWLSEE